MEQNKKQMDGTLSKAIVVRGISSKGTQQSVSYVYPYGAKNDFEALATALKWANDEYSCEYDEDGKPVVDNVYKDFATITDIKIAEF